MKTYKTVQALFRAESRWTKGYFAYDLYGNQCEARSEHAVCFCLVGAIERVYPNGPEQRAAEIRASDAVRARGFVIIARFNDDPRTTIADIRAVAKEAKI